MDAQVILKQLLNTPETMQNLDLPLSPGVLDEVITGLKDTGVDANWWTEPAKSLVFADMIIELAKQHDHLSHLALGQMARGDTLRILGKNREAWDSLQLAGTNYLDAGNEVGWARTCIGKLVLCIELGTVNETFIDAARAAIILEKTNNVEKLVRLSHSRAYVLSQIGEYQQSLEILQQAIRRLYEISPLKHRALSRLYSGAGYACLYLGKFQEALDYYEKMRELAEAEGELVSLASANSNTAYIRQIQGRYRSALKTYLDVYKINKSQNWMQGSITVGCDLVQCYLQLDRNEDAYNLAQEIVEIARSLDFTSDLAKALIWLAEAQVGNGLFKEALESLDEANETFETIQAESWQMTITLRKAYCYYYQERFDDALVCCKIATTYFTREHPLHYAEAVLLQSKLDHEFGRYNIAIESARQVVRLARNHNFLEVRYAAHLLIGQTYERLSQLHRAAWSYRAAIAVTEKAERELTITLRSSYLQSRDAAPHCLIALYLQAGNIRDAFQLLERYKTRIFSHYLANQDELRWTSNNEATRQLLTELQRLREHHHWLYKQLYMSQFVEDMPVLQDDIAERELAETSKKIRKVTERLYLENSAQRVDTSIHMPDLAQIQLHLKPGTSLVSYYSDGNNVWAFILDGEHIDLCQLPIKITQLVQLIEKLQINIDSALELDAANPLVDRLVKMFNRILQKLYRGLLEPLQSRIQDRTRLTIVPFGPLHYLPFHLLYDGESYLIESHEIVISPTASLITQKHQFRDGGVRAIAYSNNGILPEVQAEAQQIVDCYGGELYAEEAANRNVLKQEPVTILHIAAHAEFRINYPDLSYIELADGQLFADDLMQQDMSYELVTLSGCETGRVEVAARDELIGLGRGLLYSGAAALVTSLWRVDDRVTSAIMQHFYSRLSQGYSKAKALQLAQLEVKRSVAHPAFWGAFQLVGNSAPLSIFEKN